MRIALERKLHGHKGSIYSLCYDFSHKEVLSGGGDGWIVSWPSDQPDGKVIADVNDQIYSLYQMPDNGGIVAGTLSGDLFFVDPGTMNPARRKVYHQKGIYDLIECSERLITAGGDGKLGIWNPVTTEIEESIAVSHRSLRTLALNPAKDHLAVGASDGQIYVFSLDDWNLKAHIESAHKPSVFTLLWLDDSTIVSGGRDAHLRVWGMDDLTHPMVDLSAHWFTVNHLAKHPVRPVLASASRDKTIRIWNTEDFSLIKSLDASKSGGHIHSVNRLLWSDSGNRLYAASDDASISVWTTS